mmetsp:Transcript_48451/g.127933  ORF Transcript_48451/g.127933 Transcript_48451/m.127933 type:complete len:243 (-) Transcript_48451:366-1094(-)
MSTGARKKRERERGVGHPARDLTTLTARGRSARSSVPHAILSRRAAKNTYIDPLQAERTEGDYTSPLTPIRACKQAYASSPSRYQTSTSFRLSLPKVELVKLLEVVVDGAESPSHSQIARWKPFGRVPGIGCGRTPSSRYCGSKSSPALPPHLMDRLHSGQATFCLSHCAAQSRWYMWPQGSWRTRASGGKSVMQIAHVTSPPVTSPGHTSGNEMMSRFSGPLRLCELDDELTGPPDWCPGT